MILCSCRVISDRDTKSAVDTLRTQLPETKITMESVAQILERPYTEWMCLTCVPNIKAEIRKILTHSPILLTLQNAV